MAALDISRNEGSALTRVTRSVCFVATDPGAVRVFMGPLIRVLQADWRVLVATNSTDSALDIGGGVKASVHACRIERRPAPWYDLLALWSLWRLFRRERFGIVHSLLPKSGLLAMLAAWLARVPVRVHTFTGQVWVTRTGLGRWLLKLADRITVSLATHILADSPSQRAFMGREGVCDPRRVTVLGCGSICGVDTLRFRPDPGLRATRRAALGIPGTAVVILFIGRLNPDKGVMELASAFAELAQVRPDLYLMVVGRDEAAMRARVDQICSAIADRVLHIEHTMTPEHDLAAADILCLPSRREGFGNVVIEAAACGVPTVGTRIYGLVDAVAEGETGLLSAPGDISGLRANLERLAADTRLRQRMGAAARRRVLDRFDQHYLLREWVAYYLALDQVRSAMPGLVQQSNPPEGRDATGGRCLGRVCVTGAQGFIGSALCCALVRQGWVMVPAVRRARGLPGEVAVGDIGPRTDWHATLAGCDAVVHLAARAHVMREARREPLAAFQEVNTAGTLHLARQAAEAGVRRFVYLSSVKVLGEGREAPYTLADAAAPAEPYALSKWEAEQGLLALGRNTGMEIVVLRPPLVYGPGVKANFLSLMRAVARGWPLPLGAVRNRRSLLYLGNLVSAIEACLIHPAAAGQTFLVSDGEDVSTPELIRRLGMALGRPARLWPVPPPLLRLVATLLGRGAQAGRLLGSLAVDGSALRAVLGWTPPHTLDEGLRATARWYLESRESR